LGTRFLCFWWRKPQ